MIDRGYIGINPKPQALIPYQPLVSFRGHTCVAKQITVPSILASLYSKQQILEDSWGLSNQVHNGDIRVTIWVIAVLNLLTKCP